MRTREVVFIILTILLLVLTSCSVSISKEPDRNIEFSCNELKNNFDKWNSPTMIDCDSWIPGENPRLVVGTVIEGNSKLNPSYGFYEEHYTLKGNNEERKIYSISDNESLSLEIGKTYEFDLMDLCESMTSLAKSGSVNVLGFEEVSWCS